MAALTTAKRKELRGLAHHLEPVVQIGKAGVTSALIDEARRALAAHELIKVKFVDHKDEREELALDLAKRSDSELVARIGNIVILYREEKKAKKPKGASSAAAPR